MSEEMNKTETVEQAAATVVAATEAASATECRDQEHQEGASDLNSAPVADAPEVTQPSDEGQSEPEASSGGSTDSGKKQHKTKRSLNVVLPNLTGAYVGNLSIADVALTEDKSEQEVKELIQKHLGVIDGEVNDWKRKVADVIDLLTGSKEVADMDDIDFKILKRDLDRLSKNMSKVGCLN